VRDGTLMTNHLRVSLTPAQRAELNHQARQRDLPPRLRDRLEMVRLSDLGHSVEQIAATLGCHHTTVRRHLHAFQRGDLAALPSPPPKGRPPRLKPEHLAALEQLLDEAAAGGDQARTWTLPQLCAWLDEQFRIHISGNRLSVLLKERHFRWKRTKRSVRHHQRDSDLQARKAADLETLISGPGRH
jgi:transposase